METLYSELAFRPNSYDPLDYLSCLNFDPGSSTLKALECGSNQTPVQTMLDSAKLAEWLGKGDLAGESSTASVTDVSWHARFLRRFCQIKVADTKQPPSKKIDMLWEGAKIEEAYWPTTLPITIEDFRIIIKIFNLPRITPWLLVTQTPHFRRYDPDPFGGSSQMIGITMRRANYGLLPMAVALAISRDASTGRTRCIVFTDSDGLIQCILKQLSLLQKLASNPLLVPSLIQTYIFIALESLSGDCWSKYLRAESGSGQSPEEEFSFGTCNSQWGMQQVPRMPPEKLTKQILRINQLLTIYQHSFRSGFLAIESMQETLQYILTKASEGRKESESNTSAVIAQHLKFLRDTGQVTSWELQTLKERSGALMNAIYNYVAQNQNRKNAALGADTREIAAASKRDSTAMKGLAVVTMFFLPGTFFASVFAMPFFSLTPQDRPKMASSFWVFWVCAVPVTLVVFFAYTIWFRSVAGRNKKVAMDAQESFQKPFEFPILQYNGAAEQMGWEDRV